MAHQWYAIQTHSGSELAVKRALEKLAEEMGTDRIKQVLVPTEDLIEIKKGKKSIIERPLYPAYAFAEIDLDTAIWHKIQSMPKVGRFIGESKKPTPLSKKDIDAILDKVNNRAAAKPKVSFEEGEMLRIKEGPFANFNGIVEDFDMTSGVIKLNVSIFGRNTPVEISYTQVERVV
ncbi:MAG: transcription termination/antitermination protein NusG [Campylobacteraceae bacterium]|nr:transcription termination/antitermination protein NusG [Campylobacteraceae bacterium]